MQQSHRFFAPARATLTLLVVGALLGRCPAAQPSLDPIAMSVTGFQTSLGGNGWHYATVAVRLENTTDKPLPLAITASKSGLTDDRGNRYGVISVRGIGEVRGNNVDPKFVVEAHKFSDAMLELRWRPATKGVIFGVSFELDIAVSEIALLGNGQVKVGREHVLVAKGLKTNDLLGAEPKPVDAGPFTAKIADTRVTWSPDHKIETVQVTLNIKNTSSKPLVLAYQGSTNMGVDDQGNTFAYGRPGTHDTSFSGIGAVGGGKADPQFSLAPGEDRDVRFNVTNFGAAVRGSKMLYCVALVQLEVLPSNQIQELRQYSLAFSGVPAKG